MHDQQTILAARFPNYMRAYVINLDSAKDRWTHMTEAFAQTSYEVCRIPAVNGEALVFPHEGYAERLFRKIHGRTTNPREVGCYLSHVRACRALLESGEPHGLICEDDLVLSSDFESVVESALRHARQWNVLRLSGLSRGNAVRVSSLAGAYSLHVNLGRLKGAGAYILDRAAAQAFVRRLLPMRVPFDHAIDREWFYGLKAASVLPFPACQTSRIFRSSIQCKSSKHLSMFQRALFTYPYQMVNEVSRWIARGIAILRFRLIPRAVPAMISGSLPPRASLPSTTVSSS